MLTFENRISIAFKLKRPKEEEGMCSRDEQNSSEFMWKHGDKIEVMLKSVEEQLKNLRSFSDQVGYISS